MDHPQPQLCPESRFLRLPRAFFAALTAVFLGACAGVGGPSSTPRPGQEIRFTPGTFTAADSTQVAAEFGEMTLPQLRGAASPGTPVTLRLVRFRSTSATPGAPIIYLSGGTGAGISAARGARFRVFQRLRELGDVIAIDLRGAGTSEPRVACAAGEPLPVAAPIVHDTLTAILRRNAAACAAQLRQAGIVPEAFNVREIVADVDAVRAALGAPKVRLWGTSTGSQIGLEYIRRHGDRVESAVLAGVQGPDQMLDLPGEHQRVLESLDASLRAQAAPGDSAPGLIAMLRGVFVSLEREPRTVSVQDRRSGATVEVGLGRADAQLVVAGALGDRRQMAMLPRAFGAAAGGDYRMLAAFKLEGVRSGITSPYELLGDCQVPLAAERSARVQREAATALLGRETQDFPEACAGWGIAALPADFGVPVRSAVPVLLISGTLDGRTSFENADAVLQGLSRGTHLVVEGASHGDDLFLSTPEIPRATEAHFRGEPLPRRWTVPVAPAPR